MNITEIPLSDVSGWQTALSSVLTYDMYQTSEYNNLFTAEGKSVLLLYQQDIYRICLPVIIRKIPETPFSDVTSVYGYAGLIRNKENIPPEIKKNFGKAMLAYFEEKNIICAFSRLHPLLDFSDDFPEGIGKIEEVNKTVYINLKISEEAQIKQYSTSLRRQLKKLYHSDIKFRIGSKSEYKDFIFLYYQTMDRLKAEKRYYFTENYFQRLISTKEFETILIFAEKKGNLIGGGLFTCCNQFMEYHLGAVPTPSLPFSPLKGIIDTARRIGYEKGLAYLHLGGGYNGKEDSLFDFKSRFSKEKASFKVWKCVMNEKVYHSLIVNKFGNNIPGSDYFPLYRLKI